jgi:16S rRNA (uracil1498-N3)-methyltransferase
MRITRIYTAQQLHSGRLVELEAEASHHLIRVLRLGVGDRVTLFDGRGGEYPGEISAIGKKQVHVTTGLHLPEERESPLHIHLGIAVSRGERMDWVVQKSTELGVSAITPLSSEHSGVRLTGDRADKKILHWQHIATSACEQCGRNRPPVVHPLQALEHWLASTAAEQRFVLHPGAEPFDGARTPPASVTLLVGPEGGLSEHEVETARRAGYTALRLGPRVLRTETAPLAAIAILQSYWGDMRPG